VNQQIHLPSARPHRIDAEMHDALAGQHSVAATLTPELSSAYSLRGKVRAWCRAKQNGAAVRTVTPVCFTAASRSAGRDLGARRDVAQIEADARHDAVLQRVFIDRLAVSVEVPRRVDVGAGVSGIEMNIEESPCTLPDSANDSSWVFQTPWMTEDDPDSSA